MMKLRLSIIFFLVWGILCLAQAQVPLTHAGKGAPGGGGGGGISVVQQAFAHDTGGFNTTITATFGAGTTAGSVIVAVGWAQSTASTLVFTNNNSNTPTDSGLGSCIDTSSQFYTAISAFLAPTTGTTSVTVTFGNTNPYALQIYEVAGLGTKTWDTKSCTTNTGTSQSASTGALATAAEFVVVVGSGTNNCATASSLTASPGSFTFDNEWDHGCTGGSNLQTGHMITAATTSVTGTISAGFAGLITLIASVK